MNALTADERHRTDHTRRRECFRGIRACGLGVLCVVLATACSPRLALAPEGALSTSDYVEVPFSPRPPPVEIVPERPSAEAVWMDGTWLWRGGRYVWKFGAWVIPPRGARYARWVIVRRSTDGQLFFAASRWKDDAGRPLPDASFVGALGPAARARARLGAKVSQERGREAGESRRASDEATVDTGDSLEDNE